MTTKRSIVVATRVEPRLAKDFGAIAAKNERSVAWVLRRLMKDYVESEGKGSK